MAANPRHLGAQIGFLSILHTWTQTLLHHPHVHCVVPGGGLSPDGTQWIACRKHFFVPVRVLSRLFRGKLLAFLQEAMRKGKLRLGGSTTRLADPRAFSAWIRHLRTKEWVVYAKPPFGSPEHVLKYLARYTHRVAISDRRIVSMDARSVTFRYRDRAHGDKSRVMTVAGEEFLRRFLLHALPRHFVRIRYFGLLANRHRADKLTSCRQALATTTPANTSPPKPATSGQAGEPPRLACPLCQAGTLHRLRELALGEAWPQPTADDTS